MAASVFAAEAQRNSLNLCVLGVSAVSELFIIMLTNACSGKVRSFLVHSSESYANYGESSNCTMSLITTQYLIIDSVSIVGRRVLPNKTLVCPESCRLLTDTNPVVVTARMPKSALGGSGWSDAE